MNEAVKRYFNTPGADYAKLLKYAEVFNIKDFGSKIYGGVDMRISSPRQLKDRINNMAKENKLMANTVLQNFMMERLLERISVSKYKDNFILKGGFLIASIGGYIYEKYYGHGYHN